MLQILAISRIVFRFFTALASFSLLDFFPGRQLFIELLQLLHAAWEKEGRRARDLNKTMTQLLHACLGSE